MTFRFGNDETLETRLWLYSLLELLGSMEYCVCVCVVPGGASLLLSKDF